MEKEKQLQAEELLPEELHLEEIPEETVADPPVKKSSLHNNKGVAVVEIILILVVLIALVIIFRDQITALVNNIWNDINGDANTLL